MSISDPKSFEESIKVDVEPELDIFSFSIAGLIKVFFVLIIYQLIVGFLVAILLMSTRGSIPPFLKSLLTIVTYAIPMIVAILRVAPKVRGMRFKYSVGKIPPILVIVFIIIVGLSLAYPMLELSSLIPMPEFFQRIFMRMSSTDWGSIVTICVIAPILEETLCRGIILRGLLSKYSSQNAILFSAIFFAVIHLNPWQGIAAFFLGLAAGWIYLKFQSVIPCILLHSAYNCAAISLFYFRDKYVIHGFSSDAIRLMLISVSLIVLGLSFVIIRKKATALQRSESPASPR